MAKIFECPRCSEALSPVMFVEREYNGGIPTGRTRLNAEYLICDCCGKKEIVDSSTFAGPWAYKREEDY